MDSSLKEDLYQKISKVSNENRKLRTSNRSLKKELKEVTNSRNTLQKLVADLSKIASVIAGDYSSSTLDIDSKDIISFLKSRGYKEGFIANKYTILNDHKTGNNITISTDNITSRFDLVSVLQNISRQLNTPVVNIVYKILKSNRKIQ